MTKQLANQALGAVSLDGGAHFSSGCNTQTGRARLAFPREHGHEAARALETCLVDELEVGPLPDMLSGPEAGVTYFSSETVRRFRPLARRRFNTCRPSLVAMRTRKP